MILKTKKTTIESLNEDMKQNWTAYKWDGISSYKDQFGFEIIRNGNNGNYKLTHKTIFLIETLSLNAAKEISRIYLNDLISNQFREPKPNDTKSKK